MNNVEAEVVTNARGEPSGGDLDRDAVHPLVSQAANAPRRIREIVPDKDPSVVGPWLVRFALDDDDAVAQLSHMGHVGVEPVIKHKLSLESAERFQG